MTKATCMKCGYVVKLLGNSSDGTDHWEIGEAIKYLIDHQNNHICR